MKPLNYRLGMRATKTALAISLSLFICFIFNNSGMIYAAIAAISCMQHTPKKGVESGTERLFSTAVAAIVALIVLNLAVNIPNYTDFWFIIVAPLGALLTMYIPILLNWDDALPMAPMTYMALILDYNITLVDYGIDIFLRVLGAVIGIISAGLINRFIAPYKGD